MDQAGTLTYNQKIVFESGASPSIVMGEPKEILTIASYPILVEKYVAC
jgi:hypothetical protein